MWTILRRVGALGITVSCVALLQCGARTELEQRESCGTSGGVRPCQNVCGSGTETCRDGYWQACAVSIASEPCRGVCGTGVRTCENAHWGACAIPVATRSCSTLCGTGQASCEAETWSKCVVPVVQRDCSSACGAGHERCSEGVWSACDAPLPKPPVLHTTIRDFHRTQSDFELPWAGDGTDRGMVERMLGADQTPVYAGRPTTRTTPSGKAGFDVWYHDTPGVNETIAIDLQLIEARDAPGVYVYENFHFFPIDNQLFGNEGFPHNYHFTLQTHTRFVYRGGETFSFSGDDDVWVFIAAQLAIDLGGLHQLQTGTVHLDQLAPSFGLVVGQTYPLDLFFAERHTIDSEFSVRTTIADVGSCQ